MSRPDSVYFDAPLAIFSQMASSTTLYDNPVPHPNGSEGWLPTDLTSRRSTYKPPVQQRRRSSSAPPKRSAPIPDDTDTTAATLGRSASKRSNYTYATTAGSTFANGAGTLAAADLADSDIEDMDLRLADAESVLTPKQKTRIGKEEKKHGRKLSKIIKQEAKVEKKALGLAIHELGDLQKVQTVAVKTEQKSHASHSKALTSFTALESSFMSIQAKYLAAQSLVDSESQTLEKARERAKEATEHVQEKAREVDALRRVYGVDEREREVKLGELGANGGGARSWWAHGK